jgi:hypothetical protein
MVARGREETKHNTTQHNNRTQQTPYTLQTNGEGTTESQVS